MSRTATEKRAAFRTLHESGSFMLPNPWDVGSARYLASLGFQAIATTSSGFAWSTGRADNGVTREIILAHLREMVAATDLPVNADFENGFGAGPADVAASVRLAVETGVAGLSIEDSTGDAASPLFRSMSQSSGSKRHGGQSTRAAVTRYWSAVRKISSSAYRTCTIR
jgi:2-methylisocitrate lyase-like PEP mutase family enzyme